MSKLWVLAILLLSGCVNKGTGFCTIDVAAKGWVETSDVPKLVTKIPMDMNKAKIFRNVRGDYLVCHNISDGGVCGGNYELFILQPDRSYLRDEIICLE